MKRKSFGRDFGLSSRMALTTFLLGLLYVVFFVVLFQLFNLGSAAAIVLCGGLLLLQLWTSDKIALRAAGAKIVERDQAPDLHDMVERLCAMADLQKPRIAVIDTDVPERVRDGPEPQARRRRRDARALAAARAQGDRGRARARALAHREPRRRHDDDRELLLDGRRDADPLRALLEHVLGRRTTATRAPCPSG